MYASSFSLLRISEIFLLLTHPQGTHPTDLGHSRMADFYSKLIPDILTASEHATTDNSVPPPPPPPALELATGRPTATVPPTRASGTVPVPVPVPVPSCSNGSSIVWTNAATSLFVGGRAEWGGLPRENFYDRYGEDGRE